MEQVLLKAQDFYFFKFLPTVVPLVMIAPSDCTSHCPLVDSVKPDKEFVHVAQHESHARKQDKNLLCPDEQDPMMKSTVLKKLALNGSDAEQEAGEIQAEESMEQPYLESLDKKDCDMQALNLSTLHNVSKQLADVQKPSRKK